MPSTSESPLAKNHPFPPTPSSRQEGYRFSSIRELNWKALEQAPVSGKIATNLNPEVVTKIQAAGGFVGSLADFLQQADRANSAVAAQWQAAKNWVLAGLQAAPGALSQEDYFAVLTQEKAAAKTVVVIPTGFRSEGQLLQVLHREDAAPAESLSTVPLEASQTWVWIGAGAEFQWMEEWRSTGLSQAAVSSVQVHVGSGASSRHIVVLNDSLETSRFLRTNYLLEAQATLAVLPICIGSKRSQIRSEAQLAGVGSYFRVLGAFRSNGRQHLEYWGTHHHQVPETKSNIDFWTVAGGQSKVVFNSSLKIPKTATQTEAYQKNRNLLLSDKASVVTLPQLEIATDEVKCSHGATVSSIAPDQLYYMQSRGISFEEARKMIVSGFTDPVLQEIEVESVRNQLFALLEGKE